MMRKFSVLLFSLMLGVGCGDSTTPMPQSDIGVTLKAPSITMIAPTSISAGEDMSIFGEDFATDDLGQVRLHFKGVFQTTEGVIENIDIEVETHREGVEEGSAKRELRWNFGPNIPLSLTDRTGDFRGTVEAINIGLDGTRLVSTPAFAISISVKPSIIIREFRPKSAGCPVGLEETVAETPFLFEMEAVGLKAGTSTKPLRYVYTFFKEHFNFEGYVGDSFGVDPESLFPQSGVVSIVDDVTSGYRSRLGDAIKKDTYVETGTITDGGIANIVTGTDNLFSLQEIKTAPMANDAANNYKATIWIRAIDADGNFAKRSLTLKVWTPVEVDYQGESKVVRSFDPVPVSGCIPGGPLGTEVTYSENKSETRGRTFSASNSQGGSVDVAVAQLNAEFGFQVDAQVSSSESKDLSLKAFILAGEYGVMYRQTLQIERKAKLYAHGLCGSSTPLGEVVVTDWTWSPDLAKGKECPPLPPSNLPPGQVFE